LVHDAAYSEITFDGFVAPSVLQVEGAKDVAVEFHSLSKGFNMTGWRIGFCVGNPHAVGALATLKTKHDSGGCTAVERDSVAAPGLRARRRSLHSDRPHGRGREAGRGHGPGQRGRPPLMIRGAVFPMFGFGLERGTFPGARDAGKLRGKGRFPGSSPGVSSIR